ncbi:hypothetical protein [Pseudohalioglobus lutimaris]|uniref:hypothetical protein n=1 Tax=Pseudohalioglobus lutimaris TaxID=1737061 RepID=UPI0013FD2B07|nr:hypothetical protein [Pseudohalioglobus lutimaris]
MDNVTINALGASRELDQLALAKTVGGSYGLYRPAFIHHNTFLSTLPSFWASCRVWLCAAFNHFISFLRP